MFLSVINQQVSGMIHPLHNLGMLSHLFADNAKTGLYRMLVQYVKNCWRYVVLKVWAVIKSERHFSAVQSNFPRRASQDRE